MKRALISVYDKTGVVEFAKALVQRGYEIVSTSGTAKLLKDNQIAIKTIEEITKAPEVLGGRVKTLQYQIFAGILADKANEDHQKDVKQHNFELFDLVAVSLYPFSETIRKEGCTVPEAVEQIDIGGVTLIRAAAKNYQNVAVIISPAQYDEYINAIDNNIDTNLKFASEAFAFIADYDIDIANYFNRISGEGDSKFVVDFSSVDELRYGENPHQKSWLFNISGVGFDDIFEQLHGKELSYINILDIDAAFSLINEFDEPSCAILKHTNPCGVASADDICEAYKRAYACDTASPFGGIIIVNREMDIDTSAEIDKLFTEIVIAPAFSTDAFEFLQKKKNRRLIKYNKPDEESRMELKSVNGGLLVQETDSVVADENEMKIVTLVKPNDSQLKDMLFAMKVCKHTKSNSVVFAKNLQSVGIGGGQPSRVDSSMLAVEKAKRFGMDIKGSAVASDAFFPFADGLLEAVKAGAVCAIQPGGSVRDEDVIKAADENGIAMVMTGIRHFRH